MRFFGATSEAVAAEALAAAEVEGAASGIATTKLADDGDDVA